jgi:hypothetical protein
MAIPLCASGFLMPLFYREHTVIQSFNSQFGAHTVFHLVKWVLPARSGGKDCAGQRFKAGFIDVAAHDEMRRGG